MSYIGTKDYWLEVCRGNVAGVSWVNKFGRNTNVDSGVATDIWDLTTQPVWVAPTASRGHTISSTFAGDSGSGVGARTLQIYGLTGWESPETSETLELAGTSAVYTANDYVIIHRMQVLTKGSVAGGTSSNIGTVTAMALTDETTTAMLTPGEGQTLMAIYGIPSAKTAYMTGWYSSMNKKSLGATAVGVNMKILVNPEPNVELSHYVVKHTTALWSESSTETQYSWRPYKEISGPAIIKIHATGSAADLDVSAGFDMYVVDD
jgi:hypothetical protein